VYWQYEVLASGALCYEVHLKAQLRPSWHIYSQHMPQGGPLPTRITFFPHWSATLKGKIKEIGTSKIKQEPLFHVDVRYYEDQVAFIQKIFLAGPRKTMIQVCVSYQVCNDQYCLAPRTDLFTIPLHP
jgi:thiol:disulfide interchange protein DsbD